MLWFFFKLLNSICLLSCPAHMVTEFAFRTLNHSVFPNAPNNNHDLVVVQGTKAECTNMDMKVGVSIIEKALRSVAQATAIVHERATD